MSNSDMVEKQVRPIMHFKAQCYLEGTWGARSLGELECSMEMFDNSNGNAMIEFIAGDDVEHIGLSYDVKSKKIYDYEGVFSIPHEGIEFLNKLGFDTSEVE